MEINNDFESSSIDQQMILEQTIQQNTEEKQKERYLELLKTLTDKAIATDCH